jgi:hypothetical protein
MVVRPHFSSDQFFNDNCSTSSFDIERDSKTTYLTPPKISLRSVGFSPHDNVCDIPHFKDLSEEEIESIWMSKQELEAAQRNCVELVQRMNSSASLGDDSPRGLENYINRNVDKIEQIRIAAKKSVLGLQEFQNLKGVGVAALMAELYAMDAYHSQLDAYTRGLQDANDALEAHRGQ